MQLCDRISASVALRRTLSLAFALVLATPALAQNVVTLPADLDNTMYEDSGDRSNGQGPHIYAGQTFNGTLRRALVHFDLSGIPTGSTILDVELTVAVNRTAPGAVSAVHTLHRVDAQWGEGASNAGEPGGLGTIAEPGDATWTHNIYPDQQWASDGGDFDATASGSAMIGGVGAYTFTGQGLIDDVQAWIDGVSPNFGWALLGDESGGAAATARRFDSAENASGAGPALAITYQENGVPTQTTTWSSVKDRYTH